MKRIVRSVVRRLMTIIDRDYEDRYNFLRSFSQHGEDLIVYRIFQMRNISNPSYLDIGANHPYSLSNTALFYLTGSRGINVEANSDLIERFKKSRPEDVNLNIGVASKVGQCDFFIMQDRLLSTTSKSEVDQLNSFGKRVAEKVTIPTTTVENIVNNYARGRFPDFLSIDIEGMDLEVLKSIDYSRTCPKVICVESVDYSLTGAGTKRMEVVNFLTSKGYIEVAFTNLNSIMVLKSFWLNEQAY